MQTKKDLVEGKDYFIENGLMVFTKEYHLKRGYCCNSDCRNCPYGFSKEKNKKDSDANFVVESQESKPYSTGIHLKGIQGST